MIKISFFQWETVAGNEMKLCDEIFSTGLGQK